jgi:outer membrane protein OmpA-like peptidoglycan-associated protein
MLTWVAAAWGQSLGGADPVGFAPAPAAAFDDPLRVVRPQTDEATAQVLGVVSSEVPDRTGGSVWGTARAPMGPDAAVAVVAGLHARGDALGLASVGLSAPMVHGRRGGTVWGSAPFFEVPTGALGGPPGGGLRLLADTDVAGLRLTGNLGLRVAPRTEADGVATGSAALAGLAARWSVGSGAAVVLEHDLRAGVGPVAAESALSARGRLGPVAVALGTALGWTTAPGVAGFRGFVGLSAPVGRRAERVVDTDGDTLVGERDACPDEPETFDGHDDADGCPEWPASVTVEARGFLDLPVLDADVDLQLPPRWSEGATFRGAVTHRAYRPYPIEPLPLGPGRNRLVVELVPLPGQLLVTAVDGLSRPIDVAVTVSPPVVPAFELGADGRETFRIDPGQYELTARAPGRLPEVRRVVVGPAEPVQVDLVMHDEELVFTDGALEWSPSWLFVDGSDELRPDGTASLDQLATLLRTRPEIERLEIVVTADPGPDAAAALHQTQRRANNVAGYLFGRGVDPARLQARGVGSAAGGATVRFAPVPPAP